MPIQSRPKTDCSLKRSLIRNSWVQLSKQMILLVYKKLKIQTLISKMCQYFLLKKMREAFAVQKPLSFFSANNITVLGYKVVKHLTS